MTHDQLLPVYRQITGLPGQDDAYNHWVQGIIDDAGVGGTDAIPSDYFTTPKGQAYVQKTTTANSPSASSGGGAGFGALVQPTTVTPPFTQAPTPDVTGGNYNQTQNATQGGQFGTVGSTNQTTNQTTGGTTSGTVTSASNDTLGFGSLLQQQAGNVDATDASRNAFLTDVMQNGGTGFQSQLDQGIRNSLTGPQMTGAGDSARARAAGYAAAQTGRTNLDQRLGAAQQLTSPTGLENLSTTANPYIGSTQSTSGSTTGFQDLVNAASEAQSGVTTGQSSQAGAGQIPQGQPVSSGACVLCTAAVEMKLPRSNILRVLRRVINHKLNVDRIAFANAARGYFAVFTPFARWLLTHPRTATLLYPLARATVYEELRISGRRLPRKTIPCCIHWIGHTFCAAVGRFFPVQGYVTDPVITDIARRNNILFEVKS